MIKPAVQVFAGRRLKEDEGEGREGCWNYVELLQRLWHMCWGTNSGRRNRQASVQLCAEWKWNAIHRVQLARRRSGFFLGDWGWRCGWGVHTQYPASAARRSTMHKYKYAHLTSAQCTNKTLAWRFCWSGTKGGGGNLLLRWKWN